MILYVQRNKQKVGFCQLWQTTCGDYEIAYMKVDPAHRGRRIATQLLNRAKTIAERSGVDLVAFLEPDGTGLTAEQERQWLKRHGFKYQKRYDLSNDRPSTLSQYLRRKPRYKPVMIYTPGEVVGV